MIYRLTLLVLGLFCLSMNFLLYRQEYGTGGGLSAGVPIDNMIDRILTAPDNSDLEVRQGGKKIGYIRWIPNVGEELSTGKVGSEELLPEGMVTDLAGYTIDIDGNFSLNGQFNRYRISLHMEFGPDREWEEWSGRFIARPSIVEFKVTAEKKMVELHYEYESLDWDRTLTFEELSKPEKLLEEFSNPLLTSILSGPLNLLEGISSGNQKLQWKAFNDRLKIGRSTVRCYRLEADWKNQYQVSVIISKVGEILKITLPGKIVLINEALSRP